MSEYHDIIERTIQIRKGGLEQSLRSAEAEYRELIAEVRVYNKDFYSYQEKEFRTVKTLCNELASCHVTREKKKRTKKKFLVQKRGHKVANRGGSSSKSVSKLSTKQKDARKAKHKTSTSQVLHSSIPGTHLTPLSATAKCSSEDGIDDLLAAGKPAQKEPTKTSSTTETVGQTSGALVASLPLWTPPTASASGTSKVTFAPVHKVHSTSVASKAISPKGKHDSLGKAGNFSFNKGSKHDVQLFTILDTTVNPPLPRYIAKIVPESTALIPLSSSARNPPKVGSALTTLTSARASISSTHSTSSPTSNFSSSTHPKSGPTTAIPRLSSGLAQSKSNSMTATSSKSAHKNTTSSNAMKSNSAPKTKVITPITPPTVFVCDQPGCRESFSQVELLNLHKLTFHRLVLPQLIPYKNPATRYNGSLTRTGPEVVAAAHTLIDGSKKIIEKVSNKRVRSPSGSEEDSSGRKFIKLENRKSSLELTSPLHNSAPKPWRNFARKSTGRSCSMKSKRVFVNRVQLKLKKVSTKGLKIPKRTVNQVKWQNCGPLSKYTTPHGYRNPEFFRNLIRSQLKLPTTNQKATATSDYISLQPDAEPTSVKQTNKTFPGPACKEDEDSSVCARALPFIGNCARTRKFTPEVFSKPKKLSEQDRIMSSSSSSIATSNIGEEMRVPSSEDESFPLVTLSPMISQQQPSKESGNKIPKLATFELCAASPKPLPMDESAGATHDEGWEETIHSPPKHEKIQKETRISADPLPSITSTKPNSPVIKSPTVTSPGVENNEYTMRLLQTIAKLSGDTSAPKYSCDTSVTGEKSRKYVYCISVPTYLYFTPLFYQFYRSSVLSPPPQVIEDGESSDVDDESCTSLVISIDLSRLSHVPVPPPPPPCPSLTEVGVFTHRVGSFTSRGAQVERGLIIDNDVSTIVIVIRSNM